MADSINDMDPVYDATGNPINNMGIRGMSSTMPPPTSEIFRNPDLDFPNTPTPPRNQCQNYSYYIDPNFKVVRGGYQHTPSDPWFDPAIEAKYGSDAQQVCEIYVDIWRCCSDNGVREKVGTVLVARTKQMSEWVPCEISGKKGKKIVVRQFILEEDLESFFRETFRPDPQFQQKNPFFRLPNTFDFVWGECTLPGASLDYASYFKTSPFVSNSRNLGPSPTTITQAKIDEKGNRVNVIPWNAGLSSWTTDPISRNFRTGNPEWDVIFTGCQFEGPCEAEDEGPKVPDFFCVTVDSFEVVKQLDGGTNTSVPGALSKKGTPRYEITDRGRKIVLTSLEEFLNYGATKTVLDNTRRLIDGTEQFRNLSDLGFPCEREKIGDFEVDVETRYKKLTICYRPDGAILITGGLGEFVAYVQTQPAGKGEPIPGTREYDPNSECCEDAEFFAGMPPANRSRLEFDMESAEWVLIDSCACEEVQIADVWCWYGDQRNSKVHKKDVRNPITHVKKREVIDSRCKEEDVKVFHPFDRKKDIIWGKQKHITKGLFNLREKMDCYLTSSTQPTESKEYYYDVTDCDNCGREPYFAVSYGHYLGSGSLKVDNQDSNKTPTDSVYSQYQLICNDGSPTGTAGQSLPKFSFVSQSQTLESDDIYIINFYRNGLSDRLDPGNFQINLAYLSGSFYANNVHTGSNVKVGSSFVMNLIDDSNEYTSGIVCDGGQLISYNIVSGSLTNGIYEEATTNSYGKVYPQLGLIVLHPKRLNELLGFNTVTGSNINGDNSFKLFTAISGAAATTIGRTELSYLTARNITYKTTAHYFVRVFPDQANYSNNPTFVSGSSNSIFDTCFINDPNTYITSVGLYDSDKQLIGLAKLSKPIKKNFDTDLVIKIRLNW